jgi:hypothetical protein
VHAVADWAERATRHAAEVDEAVAGHVARRRRAEQHPVDDFLFTYYRYRPSHLRRWHPGVGVAVPSDAPHGQWPGYRAVAPDAVCVDPAAVPPATVRPIRTLLVATAARPPVTSCFGLHEWAMVYASGPARRHPALPLRLGPAGTDEVVVGHRLRCTHVDAVRFFTAAALARAELRPTRETQAEHEQPGCLHAAMDLYKWAYKLAPLTPSSLVLACFRLARAVRETDMRASPYDLRALGLEPIAIETAAGKAEYAAAQRAHARRAEPLRAALVAVCDAALGAETEQSRAGDAIRHIRRRSAS